MAEALEIAGVLLKHVLLRIRRPGVLLREIELLAIDGLLLLLSALRGQLRLCLGDLFRRRRAVPARFILVQLIKGLAQTGGIVAQPVLVHVLHRALRGGIVRLKLIFLRQLLALRRLLDISGRPVEEALRAPHDLNTIGAGLRSPLLAVVATKVRLNRLLHGIALIQTLTQLPGGTIDGLHRVIGVDPQPLRRRVDVLHDALGAAPLRRLAERGRVEAGFLLRQPHQDVDRHAVFAG